MDSFGTALYDFAQTLSKTLLASGETSETSSGLGHEHQVSDKREERPALLGKAIKPLKHMILGGLS